ncbi:Golgi SNAP receptor complex member 1 [Rhynchospora pubera]|uniref:Golgi SNAP receptor complex member 1 n=1 Tax=Rhynchospora pubera TaxID=906938 RepID=A0AAV8G3V5_9POAL|nr:Golgi SNAP receptor complex member 1 [Rhynchospora pubera]
MATVVVSTSSSLPATDLSASSDESTTGNWDDLRRVARKLEGDLDVRLSSYAKLSEFSDKRVSSNDTQWKTQEMEIETLLVKLTEVNEDMSQWASAAVVGANTATMQRLTRHREILHELTKDFKRTKKNLLSIKEHAELLTSVRNDINEHKAMSSIDEVIDQAEGTRSSALTVQRSAFGEIQGKLKHLNDKFPAIRATLGAIKRKKSKDNIILSAVIALFNAATGGVENTVYITQNISSEPTSF